MPGSSIVHRMPFAALAVMLMIFALAWLEPLKAHAFECTDWKKQAGVTCLFAGEKADLYKRQCENACWWNSVSRQGNIGPNCDQEEACSPKDPTTFTGPCSDWVKVDRVTCYDPNSGTWEQQWARVCTVGLKESWCSREKPQF